MNPHVLVACAAVLSAVPVTPGVGGDVLMNWTSRYGDWSKATETGEVPSNWYKTPANGRVFLRNVPAGNHTFGVSRAFGFGPLVVPNVVVADGRTTLLDMRFHTDYHAIPGDKTLKGSVFTQSFVARGDSIIKAAALFATAPQARSVKYTIHHAGPDGPPVGPTALRPPNLNALVASWCHGQVPVTPGRLYCLRVEGTKGTQLDLRLSDSADPMLPLVVDGKMVPGASLAGWVESDPPGLVSTMVCVEGRINPKPDKERCNAEFGQTFIARGKGLAMIDFRPQVPDADGEVTIEIVVRQGGPKGRGFAHRNVRGPNGSVLQAVWPPGEVRTVSGEQYCIELRNPAGGGFKMSTVAGVLYPSGCLAIDEVEVSHLDADMNIVEYGDDIHPPATPRSRILSGDGLARIEYVAPGDPDVRKLQIRGRIGPHNENWPVSVSENTLLAELDVLPGGTGVFHLFGLENFNTYSYAVYAVDVNGNYSKARVDSSFPGKGPVIPPQATVLNADFANVAAMGTRAENWDVRIGGGDPLFQGFRDRDGITSFGWRCNEDTKACLLQTVTLHPRRTYELAAKATATGTASATIRPDDFLDVTPVPLSSEWKLLTTRFTAKRADTDIILWGETAAGAEIRFTEVRIRDFTTD